MGTTAHPSSRGDRNYAFWRSCLAAGVLGLALGFLAAHAVTPPPSMVRHATALALARARAIELTGVEGGTAWTPSERPATAVSGDKADWKCVSMYKGQPKDPRLSTAFSSQVGQDRTIIDIFGHKGGGTFLDLASNDAIHLSNTMALEQQYNWTGLCVEPNPEYAPGYLHRSCTLVQAVIGPREGERVEFNFRGAAGGIVGFDNKNTSGRLQSHYTVSVAKILRDFHMPRVIDYLSLDIEGAEAWAFETFPWDAYTFLSATIERPKHELKAMLANNGYVHLCEHGNFGDGLWVHKTLPNFEEVRDKYSGRKACVPKA